MMVINLAVAGMAVWATAVRANSDASSDMYAGWRGPTVDTGWCGPTAAMVDGWLAYRMSVVRWIGLGITCETEPSMRLGRHHITHKDRTENPFPPLLPLLLLLLLQIVAETQTHLHTY
jgi:hypothetical protein